MIFFIDVSAQKQNSSLKDTLTKDTLIAKIDTLNIPIFKSEINDEVIYTAEDSIVYDVVNKKLYLYKKSKIKYTDMTINAGLINFDWTTMNLSAMPIKDSSGNDIEKPIYLQGEKEYLSEKMLYNFKSKRGKVYNVVTKEGEGYLHGAVVKKDENDDWYIKEALYTPCDHEHPHYCIKADKLKLITKSKTIVTGPANLVISDVPTPIFLPFAIIPAKVGRRSGLILPQYGFAPIFNLQ
jgi:lipopolysaccharide assembly outer membrane protein LptD (OstA)